MGSDRRSPLLGTSPSPWFTGSGADRADTQQRMEYRAVKSVHCGLIPANFTALAHFSGRSGGLAVHRPARARRQVDLSGPGGPRPRRPAAAGRVRRTAGRTMTDKSQGARFEISVDGKPRLSRQQGHGDRGRGVSQAAASAQRSNGVERGSDGGRVQSDVNSRALDPTHEPDRFAPSTAAVASCRDLWNRAQATELGIRRGAYARASLRTPPSPTSSSGPGATGRHCFL
jgi:hypothetical protein